GGAPAAAHIIGRVIAAGGPVSRVNRSSAPRARRVRRCPCPMRCKEDCGNDLHVDAPRSAARPGVGRMFGDVDAVLLARIQFAFTVSFHFIFPAFSIGLASYLAVLEALWLKTRRRVYLDLFRFWLKIFAVAFAMGVVSGIVMSYQFGTNWAVFSDRAGPIIGPLMAYEVMTAFFLEAGFLGVMLFGMNRVGPRLHFFATVMVALGTFLSAFWILSANSWMHTPTGFEVNADG